MSICNQIEAAVSKSTAMKAQSVVVVCNTTTGILSVKSGVSEVEFSIDAITLPDGRECVLLKGNNSCQGGGLFDLKSEGKRPFLDFKSVASGLVADAILACDVRTAFELRAIRPRDGREFCQFLLKQLEISNNPCYFDCPSNFI